MDTRVLVSVILNNERGKLGLEWQYTKAIDKFKLSYYVSKINLIYELATSSSDYFVFVKYANVMNLSTLEIETITIEDCIRYNVLGLNLSQSDLCDDGYIPINLFGYSESLCENIDEDDCIPFVYDGEPIKIGGKFSNSLLYCFIAYGSLTLTLKINIENNTFKLDNFMQVDGFKDRSNRDSQWYEINIKTDSLCGIYLYNQYCAYGYGVCIIDELSDDIIVPDGIKKIRILSNALSEGKTVVLPVSIDYIVIEYSNMLYNYLKSNRRILATIVMSNSIKTETLVEMVRHILKDISSSKLGDINDRDSAIGFIRKTICNLEFY